MSRLTNRRAFLKQSALAGAGYWCAAGTVGAQSQSPNEKLNIGIIGVAGRGGANTGGVANENIVALCDVDQRHLAKASQRFPKAKAYEDWREMVDQSAVRLIIRPPFMTLLLPLAPPPRATPYRVSAPEVP